MRETWVFSSKAGCVFCGGKGGGVDHRQLLVHKSYESYIACEVADCDRHDAFVRACSPCGELTTVMVTAKEPPPQWEEALRCPAHQPLTLDELTVVRLERSAAGMHPPPRSDE